MKKKIVKVFLTTAVITSMMFSVTACGTKNDAPSTTASTAQDVERPTSADNAQESTATEASNEGIMTLQEWTETDECKQFLEIMNQGMADQGVSVFFEVDGDTIALVYQYGEQIEVAENAEEAMRQLFTSNAETFESMRDQLIAETGNENTVLVVEYWNADDTVIFSQEF